MKWGAFVALASSCLFAQDGTIVSGFVLDQLRGSAIPDVSVTLRATDGLDGQNRRFQTSTDALGQFTLKGVKPGDYAASIYKNGYFEPSSQVSGGVRTVHIGSPSGPVMLRFELAPPGKLRGQVLLPDGTPANKVRVVIGQSPFSSVAARDSNVATTDEQGNFVFEKLAPGPLTLVANPGDIKPEIAPDGTRTEIVSTYYPSTTDRTLAQTIVIQPGDQNCQIRLRTAIVSRVRGVAVDPAGKPVAKAVVTLHSRIEGGIQGFVNSLPGPFTIRGALALELSAAAPVTTGDDGAFEFPSVPEGEWLVKAESQPPHDQAMPTMLGGLFLRVSRRDLDDLRIQLSLPFNMIETVELADGSSVPKGAVTRTTILSEDYGGASLGPRVRADGSFFMENVRPGRSRVNASVAPDFYVAAILLGNNNIAGRSVDLTPTSPPLRFILKRAGTITAHVEHCGGAILLLLPHSVADGTEGTTGSAVPAIHSNSGGWPPATIT